MKLKAIHRIDRKPAKKMLTINPGEEFDCPEAEADQYLRGGAAERVVGKAPAKKAAAKKAETKPAETKPAETKPAENGEEDLGV